MIAGAGGLSPLVSVIVPAYNAQSTLGETLRSIGGQQFTDFEILIIDDGSTDATRAIAAAFCAAEPRARLIATANNGVAAARNRGLSAARGTFVAPIDADDLWHPTYLAKLVARAMATTPVPALVFSGFRLVDQRGHVFGSGALVDVEGWAALRMTYTNLVGNGSAMIVRRDVALAVGGYDGSLHAAGVQGCEDHLLQMLVAARAPVASVMEYLVGYRRRVGAMSEDSERMFRSDQRMLAVALERCPWLHLPRHAARWRDARRRLALARRRVARRDFVGAADLAVRAFLLDPSGTLATALDRSDRLVRRLHRRYRGVHATKCAFDELDPADLTPVEPARVEGWLQRQQRRRMKAIGLLDEAEGGACAVTRPQREKAAASDRRPHATLSPGAGPVSPIAAI